ncbi:MAG: fumarylacetoacetate hydrolase family protein [Armatimonadetes bacterium]|nr:fumarylacetoacetate hydrolase family protein [Armatimonadota bacterium]
MRFALLADRQDIAVLHTDGVLYNVSALDRDGYVSRFPYPSRLPGNLYSNNTDLLSESAALLDEAESHRFLSKYTVPSDAVILAPVPRPARVLAIGRNYAEHAKEQGANVAEEPIVFLKASQSVIAHREPIVIPPGIGRVDYEAELAVVIGRGGRNIAEADAYPHVAGYTILNDITARDMQKKARSSNLPWFLSKSLDTFCPMGPYLVTPDEIPDPHNLRIMLSVNNVVMQDDTTASMVFKIPTLIAYLSRFFALEPGDVIATGTPSGIGAIVPGDTVSVTITGLGTLTNPVVAG